MLRVIFSLLGISDVKWDLCMWSRTVKYLEINVQKTNKLMLCHIIFHSKGPGFKRGCRGEEKGWCRTEKVVFFFFWLMVIHQTYICISNMNCICEQWAPQELTSTNNYPTKYMHVLPNWNCMCLQSLELGRLYRSWLPIGH